MDSSEWGPLDCLSLKKRGSQKEASRQKFRFSSTTLIQDQTNGFWDVMFHKYKYSE